MPEGVQLSKLEIATIDAIVSLYETNTPGKYDAIARAADDLGGLSYGKHQAALTKGSLHALISQYCGAENARFTEQLSPYLPQMEAGDRTLDRDDRLVRILVDAAQDPVMQRTQDDYFAEHYMGPALREAQACGFATPLGCAVVYDSFVQGSWSQGGNIKGRTVARVGEPNAQNEREWITAYVNERRAWLAGHSNPLLPRTVYRMDCFRALIANGAWELELPLSLSLNGFTFTLTAWDLGEHLFPDPLFRVEADKFGVVKARRAIVAEGRDKHVQGLLAQLGLLDAARGAVDGKFGAGSAAAVRTFQLSCGREATGEVDSGTYVQLSSAVRRRTSNEHDSELTPLPEQERTGSGNVLAGGSVVAGVGGAGAAVGGAVLTPAPTQETPPATPPPPATTPTTDAGAGAPITPPPGDIHAQTPTDQPSTPPAATDVVTAPQTPTPAVPEPPAQPAPSTNTHTEVPAQQPREAAYWAREALPWAAIGLVLLAVVLLTLARRRAY